MLRWSFCILLVFWRFILLVLCRVGRLFAKISFRFLQFMIIRWILLCLLLRDARFSWWFRLIDLIIWLGWLASFRHWWLGWSGLLRLLVILWSWAFSCRSWFWLCIVWGLRNNAALFGWTCCLYKHLIKLIVNWRIHLSYKGELFLYHPKVTYIILAVLLVAHGHCFASSIRWSGSISGALALTRFILICRLIFWYHRRYERCQLSRWASSSRISNIWLLDNGARYLHVLLFVFGCICLRLWILASSGIVGCRCIIRSCRASFWCWPLYS